MKTTNLKEEKVMKKVWNGIKKVATVVVPVGMVSVGTVLVVTALKAMNQTEAAEAIEEMGEEIAEEITEEVE